MSVQYRCGPLESHVCISAIALERGYLSYSMNNLYILVQVCVPPSCINMSMSVLVSLLRAMALEEGSLSVRMNILLILIQLFVSTSCVCVICNSALC